MTSQYIFNGKPAVCLTVSQALSKGPIRFTKNQINYITYSDFDSSDKVIRCLISMIMACSGISAFRRKGRYQGAFYRSADEWKKFGIGRAILYKTRDKLKKLDLLIWEQPHTTRTWYKLDVEKTLEYLGVTEEMGFAKSDQKPRPAQIKLAPVNDNRIITMDMNQAEPEPEPPEKPDTGSPWWMRLIMMSYSLIPEKIDKILKANQATPQQEPIPTTPAASPKQTTTKHFQVKSKPEDKPLPANYSPAPDLQLQLTKVHGAIDSTVLQRLITSFHLYWAARSGSKRPNWNTVFIRHVEYNLANIRRTMATEAKDQRRDQTLLERLTDDSWAYEGVQFAEPSWGSFTG